MSYRIACITAVIGLVILIGCGEQPAPTAPPVPEAKPAPAAAPAPEAAPAPAAAPAPEAAPAPVAAAADGEALFKESCSVCHLIGKPIAYKGDTPWKDTVDRMIQHGAKITPEDAALIVKYLETTYPRPQK